AGVQACALPIFRLFFVTQGQTGGPSQLWRSDGTAAGTTAVFSTTDLNTKDISQLAAVGDKVFFVSRQGDYYTELDHLLWIDATLPEAQPVTAGVFGTGVQLTNAASPGLVI